jgi:hypothetical protein
MLCAVHIRRLLVSLAALALALAVALPAAASVMLALDLPTLVARASEIAVVRVESQRARWDGRGRIVTDVSLRVEETLKGTAQPGELLTLERFGGALGDLGMRVEGEPTFADGARVLVFAVPSVANPAHFRPVGMAQGVMPVRERAAPNGDDLVLPGGEGLALMQRVNGALVASPPALASPRSLTEVRDAIGARLLEVRRAP